MVLRLRGARSFQRQVSLAGAELEALGVKGARAMTGFARSADRLKSVGSTLTRGITLPVAGLSYFAGKVAVDFDKSMRNVNSIAQLSEGQFANLSEQVRALAGPTAQSPVTLADGLYDLVSSGFDAAESMRILKASANAATAGLTTTDVSTKAVAAVLNAYRLPASAAQKVSDQLFRTVDRGVINFEDLASNIGDVLPFASSLGVGLDQVGASIATMTKAGLSPAETMTRIKAVMTTMLKPGEDLAQTLKDLGYESGEAMIHQLGFQGAMDKLAQSVGGSKSELAALFPNVRALGGILSLTGDNSKAAGQDVKGMADATGSTAKALKEQSKSVAFQWNKLKAQAEALAISMGPTLLGAARGLIDVIGKLVGWFQKLPEGVQKTAVQVLLLVAAVGPLTSAFGYLANGVGLLMTPLVGAINFFKTFFLGLKAGQGVIGSTRIALAGLTLGMRILVSATVIGAVITAIMLLDQKLHFLKPAFEAIKGVAVTVFNWIKEHWHLLASILFGPFGFAVGVIIKKWEPIKNFFVGVWDKIKSVFSDVVGFFKGLWGPVFDWLEDKIQWFEDKIQSIRDTIADVVTGGMTETLTPGEVAAAEQQRRTEAATGPGSNAPAAPAPSGSPDRGGGTRQTPKVNPIDLSGKVSGGGRGRGVHHTTVINLDGQKVAENTVRHLERAGARR